MKDPSTFHTHLSASKVQPFTFYTERRKRGVRSGPVFAVSAGFGGRVRSQIETNKL
jgi:hypothetical protein